MTREEVVAIAERFVAGLDFEVGPVEVVHYFDGSQYSTPRPPHWGVYFKDLTPAGHWRRQAWGDVPTIVMVDDATGRAELFCYL